MNQSVLKLSLLSLLAFIVTSCAVNHPVVQEREKWQLFTEINRGQYQLLVDTLNLSKLEDGIFKCSAKMAPSPKRVTALREAINKGNKEAGVGSAKDEQLVNKLIEGQTKLHKCEIACKQDKFFLFRVEQHIIEFNVWESGPEARNLFDKVCK